MPIGQLPQIGTEICMAFGEEILLSSCLVMCMPTTLILFYFLSPCAGCLGCLPAVGPIVNQFFGMCTNYTSIGSQILANLPNEWIGVCQMICPMAGGAEAGEIPFMSSCANICPQMPMPPPA